MENDKETPNQTGPQAEGGSKLYSQSEVDSLVSKALKTREENLNRDFAAKLSETQASFEGLKKENEALKLQSETTKVLVESGLTELSDVFTHDLSTIDGRKNMIASVQKHLAAKAAGMLNQNHQKPQTPISGNSVNVAPDQMTPDQYKEYRKNLGRR